MKKYFTIILLAVFITSSGQSNTDFNKYYKSGQIHMENKFDRSCSCSKVIEYFESGKIRSIKSYLHTGAMSTQADGEDIKYFESGTIQIYYLWKKGTPAGRIYSNFADGTLAYEKFFTNGFKVGDWKFYNQNGTLREEEDFVANKTPWDSNNDYAIDKFYFNKKVAYTVELVAGKRTNLTISDQDGYKKLTTPEPPTGKKLFVQNCAMCHSSDIDIVGPMMKGVTNKRTNDWLTKMITNGEVLRKGGDKDAITLYSKWNIEHPSFEQLSDEEVNAIIGYLNTLK